MNRLADPLPHRDASSLLDAQPQRLARLKARRKRWLAVHVWLGLVAGAVLAVAGLTGSVLVFWQEIDTGLNADLLWVEAPAGAKVGWIEFPRQPDAALSISYAWPAADDPGQAFGWPGRILVFLCGLACPLLYVTGVIRWLQKRRAETVRSQARVGRT